MSLILLNLKKKDKEDSSPSKEIEGSHSAPTSPRHNESSSEIAEKQLCDAIPLHIRHATHIKKKHKKDKGKGYFSKRDILKELEVTEKTYLELMQGLVNVIDSFRSIFRLFSMRCLTEF